MRRLTALRDKALILTLLDSALRASEACALRICDLDMKVGKLIVKNGVEGGAKGRKGRVVFLGKTARRAIWRYLVSREDGEDLLAPIAHYRQQLRNRKDESIGTFVIFVCTPRLGH